MIPQSAHTFTPQSRFGAFRMAGRSIPSCSALKISRLIPTARVAGHFRYKIRTDAASIALTPARTMFDSSLQSGDPCPGTGGGRRHPLNNHSRDPERFSILSSLSVQGRHDAGNCRFILQLRINCTYCETGELSAIRTFKYKPAKITCYSVMPATERALLKNDQGADL